MSGSIDWKGTEAWSASDSPMLTPGRHVVTVYTLTHGRSRNGYPQFEVEVGNREGSIRDWLTLTANSAGKVVALFEAAGIGLPPEGPAQQDPESAEFKAHADLLKEKTIGILVGREPDWQDDTKERTRVQGYYHPTGSGGEVPADTTGLAGAGASAGKPNDDVPF